MAMTVTVAPAIQGGTLVSSAPSPAMEDDAWILPVPLTDEFIRQLEEAVWLLWHVQQQRPCTVHDEDSKLSSTSTPCSTGCSAVSSFFRGHSVKPIWMLRGAVAAALGVGAAAALAAATCGARRCTIRAVF
mmetsp:Transcript_58269/g.162436  ORF Transcript_58269/g.162436 Transcript_58269/m.162436 type:complete len:131 (+) Transcript_58269:107-499(+)